MLTTSKVTFSPMAQFQECIEATEKNQTSCLTQKNTAHVNLDSVSGLLVLLHTIACIIELGHGGAELIKIITKCVRVQIIGS